MKTAYLLFKCTDDREYATDSLVTTDDDVELKAQIASSRSTIRLSHEMGDLHVMMGGELVYFNMANVIWLRVVVQEVPVV